MLHTSRFLSVVACKKFVRSNLPSAKPLVSIALMILLFAGSIPPAIASSLAREAVMRSGQATSRTLALLTSLFNSAWTRSTNPARAQGVRPRPPESKFEREDRVASLRINPSGDVVLQSRQPMLFTAVPLDRDGTPIHGLHAEWASSDRQVIFIQKTGQAIAGKPGRAMLTARAGRKTETVQVTVTPGSKDEFGPRKQDSVRTRRRAAQDANKTPVIGRLQNSKDEARHNHAASLGRSTESANPLGVPAVIPQRPPADDPLPDNETNSLYQPSNAIGSPPGKKKPGAMTPAAATQGTETNGNQNFTFALPVVGMAGRGLDVSLALVYNSQTWNKSTDPNDSSTWMSYDVDSGWPCPGFRLGFGQIEDQGSYGFTLTDPDGTRHALVYSSSNDYDTTDGSFIHYHGGSTSGTVYYPDGTIAYYGAGGSGGYRLYPYEIEDRNGNYILINYVSGVGPKISSIEDTLQRYIHFYYASNGDLVTITAPGLGTSDLQVMRFYYQDITLSTGIFGSGINVSTDHPSTVHTLQYVYLPSSSDSGGSFSGYRFDYRNYGVMYQATELRGMTVSSTSTSSAGSVTSDGSTAAQTTYDYPSSPTGLTDVPTYSTRTDDWAGRTTSMSGGAPYYTFSVSHGSTETVSTITAPDGTVSETHAKVNAGQWDDGILTDTYLQYGSTPTVLAHTKLDWETDSNGNNLRVHQVRTTDVPAGLTKATVLSYTSYNNVSNVSERDFTTDGSVSSTELRHTDTTYVTSSSYTNRHLLHLPSSVQVFPGGSTTPSARVDYAYDNYSPGITSRDDIIMHDPAFDPFQQTQELNCHWECWDFNQQEGCIDWEWVCTEYNPYNPATDYRGNVTSVITYPDATTTSGTITHSTTYDIAGNVMTAQVDCCQQKSFTYSGAGSGAPHDYANVISVSSGNPGGTHVTAGASYDYNTGLVSTTADENSQTTSNSYLSNSLRLSEVDYPDGGIKSFNYSDALAADANGKYHSYFESSTKLDSTHSIVSRRYFDGRGAVARTMSNQTSADGWSTQDTEYDTMGRAYRVSNAYYASNSGAAINSDGYWTTSTFDHLGRVTQVTIPRGDNDNTLTTNVQTSFDGVYATVSDQAGKVRRQKVDALGRVIRLDEPTSSGLGSTSSPNQATNYSYDALDNLVHINQGSQDRYFKFDSFSRLIRERQVEQDTNSSYNLSDSLTGNSSWTRRVDYNSSGLVTDAYDARGVHTQVSYDDLNRVTQISYSDSTPTAHYYYDSQTLPSGAPSYTHSNNTGRLLGMTYGSGATGDYFAYDSMGRVVTQKQVTGSTTYGLSYTYNYAGELTGETYPSGRALSYSYDDGGRLSQVNDSSTTFANTFTYAAHGGLSSETWGNSAVHTMSYNRRLQASQAKLSLSSTVLQQYDYNYGEFNTSSGDVDTSKNNGQIGKVLGTIGATAQWNQGFSYDELGRLSNVAEHQGSAMTTSTYSQGYTYDRYGNRAQSANSTLGLPAVALTDYSTSTNRFGSGLATYDAAGNITTDSKFRSLSYAYDANGMQTSASQSGLSESATYDSAGQRVQTSVTTTGTTYRTMVYDIFGQDVADYSGSTGGTLERENIYRGGQLLATYESGSSAIKYVLTDVQGSTRAIMNNSGTSSSVIARHDYLPFGEEISSGIGLRTTTQGYGATDTNRQKYALTERDDATGLDHTWFRKYESFSGRMTSPDSYTGSMTIGDPQSFNRYSYTQNDPVNFVDPTGLDPWIFSHSLFGNDWLLSASQQGWNQIYGLNPISFTFMNHEQSIDGYVYYRTTITLWNSDQQSERLAAALAELRKRIEANGGKNPCAKFFGGLKKALKALDKTKFTFDPNLDPNAQTVGTRVTLNSSPDRAFMRPAGSTYSFDLVTASPYHALPDGGQSRSTSWSSLALQDVTAAAFLLAHELGHRTHSYGDNQNDGALVDGAINNMAVWKACFSDKKPTQ